MGEIRKKKVVKNGEKSYENLQKCAKRSRFFSKNS